MNKLIVFNKDTYEEKNEFTLDDIVFNDGKLYWLDIESIEDVSLIKAIAKKSELHPLMIDEILDEGYRVKLSRSKDYVFLTVNRSDYNREDLSMNQEKINMIKKDNLIVTIQREKRDFFGPIRKDMEEEHTRFTHTNSFFLIYMLIDFLVDTYFATLDTIGDINDDLEEGVIEKREADSLKKIYSVKKELMFLRKSVYPLREAIGILIKQEDGKIDAETLIYLRDLYDHLIEIVETVETHKDIMSNMIDIYLSSISNRTNDVMKVLTMFSTIFIPLTFLAGIYGMNFKFMPELGSEIGYPLFWVISVIVIIVMLIYFKRKKWF